MRIVLIATMIALLAVPANARGRGNKNAAPGQSAEQKAKDDAIDKQYRATLDKIPDQKSDPWSGVRAEPVKVKKN